MTERRGEIGAQGWGKAQLQSNQPELADLVFRSLDLKGRLPLELDREYQLGMTVEDLTKPEFYRSRRKAYWGGGVSFAAVPGNVNVWQILAPTTDVITVVESVIIAATTTDLYRIGITVPGAGLTAFPVRSLDSRNSPTAGAGSGASTFQAGQSAVSVIGSGSVIIRCLSNTTVRVDGPWILGPDPSGGTALVVEQGLQNTAGVASFIWTERHAVPSEVR